MNPKFIFSFLILLITNVADAQESKTFSGTVTDINSGEPVRGANVYFEQTTLGTSTGSDGEFEFSARLEGVHRLHFSFVGYETVTRTIDFDEERTRYTFTIELSPATFFLGEVHVADSNVEWQEHFTVYSLGTQIRSAPDEISEGEKQLALHVSRIRDGSGDRFKGFALRRGMDVDHGRFDQRRSSIIPLHRDGLIFVDRFGNLLDPDSVEITGEWSNHRIANMLPLDYRIE